MGKDGNNGGYSAKGQSAQGANGGTNPLAGGVAELHRQHPPAHDNSGKDGGMPKAMQHKAAPPTMHKGKCP